MYFFLWFVEAIIFMIAFTFRIMLASRIFDFRIDCSNPLDSCALLNKYLLPELILHSIFTAFAIIIPFRSFLLFFLNILLIIRGWFLYNRKQLDFSPFQLVRDVKKRQRACTIYIVIFIISFLILIYKLVYVSILSESI